MSVSPGPPGGEESAEGAKASAHATRLRLLRPHAGRLLGGLAFMALGVAVQLAYPQVLAHFIDGLGAHATGEAHGAFAPLLLAALLVQAVAAALRYYLFDSAGLSIVTHVRRLAYDALVHRDMAFHDGHGVGELASRLTADAEALRETLTTGLALSLRALIVLVAGFAMLLWTSAALSAVFVVALPLGLLAAHRAGHAVRRYAGEAQALQAHCGKVSHEYLANVRLVQAMNQQDGAIARYRAATARALAVSIRNTRLLAVFHGSVSLLVYVALFVTLWLGAGMIEQGRLTIGGLTAFVLYAAMVAESASSAGNVWTDWMRMMGATDRLFAIVGGPAAEATAKTSSEATGEFALRERIEFRDVAFCYPQRRGQQVLNGLNLTIAAGQRVALVGASGAGKTTVANLLLGFYPPDSGTLTIDGGVCARIGREALRARMAIVEQEPCLFSESLFENIAFAVPGRRVTAAEVVEAAKGADAHGFIMRLPQGYDTVVGDRGAQLSGGQRQRIAIARALLRDPQILILDEATSALDAISEAQVRQALRRLMQGRTTIIIAHRYASFVDADRIFVLDHGRVVQCGTHGELLADRAGAYWRLVAGQMSA